MVSSILYYLFSATAILYYGIGVNRLLTFKMDFSSFAKSLFKVLILTVFNILIDYVFIKFVLIPLNILEFFSVVAVGFFTLICFLIHFFLKQLAFDFNDDFVVPFLIVFLSLIEGFSLVSCLVINLSLLVSFYGFLFLVYSLKLRFFSYDREEGVKPFALILISLSIVFIAFYSWNVSWINLALK